MTAKSESEYSRKFREMRKRQHLCAYCGNQDEQTLNGKAICAECSDYYRKRREARKRDHMCVKCGVQDERTMSGHVTCQRCYEKGKAYRQTPKGKEINREASKELYDRMKESGTCVCCRKEPAAEGYVTCFACRVKLADRRRMQRQRKKEAVKDAKQR